MGPTSRVGTSAGSGSPPPHRLYVGGGAGSAASSSRGGGSRAPLRVPAEELRAGVFKCALMRITSFAELTCVY